MQARSPVAKSDMGTLLANGLVLAEFDIDKGSCVRTYYPKASAAVPGAPKRKPIGVNVFAHSEYFANHMLPDGAEKLVVGRTVFVVNRPRSPAMTRFAVFAFTSDQDGRWTRVPSSARGAATSDILQLDMKTANISVRSRDEVVAGPVAITEENVNAVPLPAEVRDAAAQLVPAVEAPPVVSKESAATRSAVPPSSPAGLGGFTFVVVAADGVPPLGLLMPVDQQEAFIVALAKALAPPTPPLVPLYAQEEEAPHEPIALPPPGEGGESPESPSPAPDATAQVESVVTLDPTAAPPADGEAAAATSAENDKNSADPLASGAAPPTPTPTPTPPPALAPVPSDGEAPTASPGQQQVLPLTSASLATVQSTGAGDSVRATPKPTGAALPGVSVASVDAMSTVSSPTTRGEPTVAEEDSGEVLYGLCAVVSKRDSSARRGGITKAVALLGTSLSWLEPFFNILVETAQYCCDIPGADKDAVKQQTKVLKLCYDAINAATPAVTAGMEKTSHLVTEVSQYCILSGGNAATVAFHTAPFGLTHKVRIPLAPTSHDIAFTRYSLEGLIESFGPAFMNLVQGIMTEQKIVVLCRQGLSTDVAEATIALGALGNSLDPQFIAEKVFPYTSINSVDHFISLPGYVIGTLNPIFENEQVWHWDVLCDLDKKTVVLKNSGSRGASASGGQAGKSGSGKKYSVAGMVSSLPFGSHSSSSGGAGHGDGDSELLTSHAAQFFKNLVSSISHMRALRIPVPERNRRLRLTLEEFMQTAVVLTYAQDGGDTDVPMAALSEQFTNAAVASLRSRCRLTALMSNVPANILFPGESPSLILLTAALRRCKGLDSAGVLKLLVTLRSLVSTDNEVRLLLRRMTIATGGLSPIGMQLNHPSMAVRKAAVQLLTRIEEVTEGKAAVAAMNGFLILVYEDQKDRY